MQTIGDTQDNSSQANQQLNNNSPKKLQGFAAHPENINRKGAVKREWTWKSQLEDAMEEALKDGQPVKKHLARSLIREALKGNIQAINSVMDRMDGKALQPVDHTTQGDKIVGPVVYIPEEKK